MIYVNSDGTIGVKPLYKKGIELFWGSINFISIFFQTLINPNFNGKGNQYVTDYKMSSGSSGGGPPAPPRRRIGGFATLSSVKTPMLMAGG